ncbi:MAG: PD-(D/E)XK nuclease family protein [Planctomycetota bacterium]|jgi:ATP-dependent helicase/nuclease subunit B
MSIRFVVGRAGSGKTHRCLEAIRAGLREDAAGGEKLLLVVPEQASFQMERALIETADVRGYTRCEVLSFQRLAYRIFAEMGADPRRADQTIGSLGRMMVIRLLIDGDKARLQVLGRVADKPGLIKQVADNVDELIREQVEPELLGELAERCREDNPLGSAKLADLARIYRGYLDYLIDERMDPAQYLNLAAERLGGCDWLAGARVWVDGFAGFTQQEYQLLVKLAQKSAEMEITMLVDPSASAIEAASYPRESYSLFARTEWTLVELRNKFQESGLEIGELIRLGGSSGPRFVAAELGELERQLFNPRAEGSPSPVSPEVIRIVEVSDRRAEVEAAIGEIQRLTREADPPLRYREVAVIVRDLEAYHDLLSSGMRTHGIPYFIDRRQPTSHHAFIELIRGLLAVAADDCSLDSVRLLLKTGLLGLDVGESDLLENYLLSSGIAGRSVWNEEWPYTRFFQQRSRDSEPTEYQQSILRRVNEIRTKFLKAVGAWLAVVDERPRGTGQQWAEGLYACLKNLEVDQRLYQWSDKAEADGRSDIADTHRQVWIDFVELLDEFVRVLGAEAMGVKAFGEVMEASLAEFNLGLAPPTLDQVLVGAIERSRHPPVRAVLILGFDENHFPMVRAEDPLLGDGERELLESAGASIGQTRRRQLLDERMLAYIAMTRASERLWISYPRTDGQGKALQPSPFLEEVLSGLGGLTADKPADPHGRRSALWLCGVGELGGRLASEFRYRPTLDDESDLDARSLWNSLYESARGRDDWRQTLGSSLGGLKYENSAELEAGSIDRAVRSPSQLERYAACPFAHFVEYTLGLESRVEADLGNVDLGSLCHAILEKFVGQLSKQKRKLAELEDDEIAERIDNVAGEMIADLGDDIILAQARNAYLCDRTRGHLGRVVRWQRDAARVGKFHPEVVEFPFGFSGDSADPLTLTTPKGRTIGLRGYIDRVDVADLAGELLGTVIDYKRSTDKKLNFAEVYHGLALQLVGYLLALQQVGESLTGRVIRPVAAFYLPLLEAYQTLNHPNEVKKSSYRWRGIIDTTAVNVLDETVAAGGGSQYMSARISKKGEPYTNSDLAGRDQLTALMQHVGRRMGQLADALLDGKIEVKPYRLRRRMPCSYCAYKTVCRYEIETQPPRLLESVGKAEVFKRVMEEGRDE